MSFVPLGWIDTWALCCALRRNQHDLQGDELRILDVLTEERPTKWQPALNVVARAKRTLRQAEKMIPALASFDVAEAQIEWLDAGASLQWATMPDDEIRIDVAIVTNPLCLIYAWPEARHVAVGEIVAIPGNKGMRLSSVNFGETPRAHLVLGLRQRAPGFVEFTEEKS